LNRIKAQEIAAVSAADSYSDPAVILVAWAENGKLILPWESPEPNPEPFARAVAELEKVHDDAMRTLYTRKQPAQAAEMLRSEIQKTNDPMRLNYLRILLALTFKEWEGHRQEAADVYAELLRLPSDMVNDSAAPKPLWHIYAANMLIEDGVRERDVLARVEQDLGSFSTLARWNTALSEMLRRLRRSRDAAVARGAEMALEILARRLDRLEQLRQLPQARALQTAFQSLGVTPENWPSFGTSDWWFIGTAPQTGTRSLVVAVRAEDIRKSVESERQSRGADTPFHLAVGGNDGQSMGENLPGWRAVLEPPTGSRANPEGAPLELGMSLQQWFYVLSLALIVGLTLFGGHLLWRDTRRETRMAELRSQFVSSVSHELKTPLTGIRMFAETLQMRGMSDPEIHSEYLETIVNETERLTRLLNNVLDFSKIERGQKNYHMQSATLSGVLDAVTRTMRFPLSEQGFDLRMDIAGDIPPMNIDRDAIEQAILNLVSNAMKYSGESRVIDLRLFSEGGNAKIRVTDRGLGIPAEEQKRIFEKFYRVPTPENRAISGTGLGLALVAHIAEAHGGSVEVESAVGQGSTFTIVLPIDSGDAVAADVNEPAHVRDAS
jgi:signal transduction histidine kinase